MSRITSINRAAGSLLRGLGRALEGLGSAVQGSGAYKETCEHARIDGRKAGDACVPQGQRRCRSLSLRSHTSAVNKAQAVQAFAGKRPQLAEDVFVAPNASVVGDVKLGSGASVWYGAIIRGERILLAVLPLSSTLWQPTPQACVIRHKQLTDFLLE